MMVLLGIRTYYVPDTDIARYASALSKPSDLNWNFIESIDLDSCREDSILFLE